MRLSKKISLLYLLLDVIILLYDSAIIVRNRHKSRGCNVAMQNILLTKSTAALNEVALSHHKVCGLHFLTIVFAATITYNYGTAKKK